MNILIYIILLKIPIIDYHDQIEGIIKKQIKISCDNKKQFDELETLIKQNNQIKYDIIKHIDNPNGRIKFKDIRKITIGLSKKDILFNKVKDRSAFYNCFVLTLRIYSLNKFKEYHIKVFNTGKLEKIPGLQQDNDLDKIINTILYMSYIISINNSNIKSNNNNINVLVNSKFNCGYFINREKLFRYIKIKYYDLQI